MNNNLYVHEPTVSFRFSSLHPWLKSHNSSFLMKLRYQVFSIEWRRDPPRISDDSMMHFPDSSIINIEIEIISHYIIFPTLVLCASI